MGKWVFFGSTLVKRQFDRTLLSRSFLLQGICGGQQEGGPVQTSRRRPTRDEENGELK